MTRFIKNVIITLCFILVFLFVLNTACEILERKNSDQRYAEFWSDPENYDVWLMGTSHMYYGIQPMWLWERYGIRSYNLAAPSSLLPQTYWTLKCALNYAQPKVVIVDCYHVHQDKMISSDFKKNHTGIDSIPFSMTKVQAMFDLFETMEDRVEFLFNLFVYHNRWEELGEDDFHPRYSLLKGASLVTDITDISDYQLVDESDMMQEETIGYVYLRKIVEECQARGIQVVLTAIPCHIEGDMVQRGMNGVVRISEEYNVPFLNLIYDDGLPMDYQIDYKDPGHMNRSGAQKATKYIGEYLSENFAILREGLDAETIKAWDQDYAVYREHMIRLMKRETVLTDYLVHLSDEMYSCEIYQDENKEVEPESTLGKLLNNVANAEMISYDEAVSKLNTDFDGDFAIIVKDSATKEVLDTAYFKNGKKK